MTDLDTMKADMAVLADDIALKRYRVRKQSFCASASDATYADALQRIHDYLSARLADAEQPAVAGDGELLEALEKVEGIARNLHSVIFRSPLPRSADNPVAPVNYAAALEMVQQICGALIPLQRKVLSAAAPSTSVPAGVVVVWGVYLNDGRFMDIASGDKQTAIDMAEVHYETGDYVVRPLYAALTQGPTR